MQKCVLGIDKLGDKTQVGFMSSLPGVRMSEPMRRQGVIRFEMPEDTLPSDHRARLVWRVLETLELSGFSSKAKSVEGLSLLSTRMLLTLWVYGISVGMGSARELARRTTTDDAFRWIVGDQEVSHQTLSGFRVGHGAALDKLLTDILGGLLHKGLLSLERVAQDGTRVRASCSAPSFRRASSLQDCRAQAALHLHAVLAEAESDASLSAAQKAARLAGALSYQARVEQAISTYFLSGSGVQARLQRAVCNGWFGARRPAHHRRCAGDKCWQRHGQHHPHAGRHQGSHREASRSAARRRGARQARVHRDRHEARSGPLHERPKARAGRRSARERRGHSMARIHENRPSQTHVSCTRGTLRALKRTRKTTPWNEQTVRAGTRQRDQRRLAWSHHSEHPRARHCVARVAREDVVPAPQEKRSRSLEGQAESPSLL